MKTKVITTGQKVAQYISMAVIGVAIMAVLWIGYLLFDPVKILDVEVPLPVSPTEVKAGDIVNVNFDYCKYEDYDSHIKVDFIGDYVIPTLSTTRSFELGCHTENLAISIPAGSPEGVYNIRLEIDYYVNVLRRETYVFDSVDVKVINGENKDIVQIGESEARTEGEK